MRQSVIDITGDVDRPMLLRMYAFRTLCAITPKDKSVLEEIEDIGTALGLYRIMGFSLTHQDADLSTELLAGICGSLLIHALVG